MTRDLYLELKDSKELYFRNIWKVEQDLKHLFVFTDDGCMKRYDNKDIETYSVVMVEVSE